MGAVGCSCSTLRQRAERDPRDVVGRKLAVHIVHLERDLQRMRPANADELPAQRLAVTQYERSRSSRSMLSTSKATGIQLS